MPGDNEAELLGQLTHFVDAWTRIRGGVQAEHAVTVAPPGCGSGQAGAGDLAGESRESVLPADFLSTAQVSALLAMGYLESRQQGGSLDPTTEALNLTDPWLCPELATSLQAAFHDGFLRWKARDRGA